MNTSSKNKYQNWIGMGGGYLRGLRKRLHGVTEERSVCCRVLADGETQVHLECLMPFSRLGGAPSPPPLLFTLNSVRVDFAVHKKKRP